MKLNFTRDFGNEQGFSLPIPKLGKYLNIITFKMCQKSIVKHKNITKIKCKANLFFGNINMYEGFYYSFTISKKNYTYNAFLLHKNSFFFIIVSNIFF